MIRHIVIVGPTASGKTSLSIDLANKYNAEIICADSRTVYKEMDIGTAKPTTAERGPITHHCLDLVYPNELFTVADFKNRAKQALGEICAKNKLAITVGGSGLYINSFLYDYSFVNHNIEVYENYKDYSVEDLQKTIIDKGLNLPENHKNKRYLLNTLARGGNSGTATTELPDKTVIIGVNPKDEDLKDNISNRLEMMLNNGVIKEIEYLSLKYGENCRALQGGIYSAFRPYIKTEIDITTAKQRCITYDWQLAKRQRTWFKRNQDIKWFENIESAKKWLIQKI